MSDIFLSYAKKDKKRASQLVENLEGAGWTVFWDTRLLSGDAWARRILEELTTAKCVVVLWSQTSVSSDWVHKEADIAMSRKTMLPASIDGTLPPPGFRGLQAENLRWWNGRQENAALKRLKISISRILDPNAPLSRLPPPDDEPWIRWRHVIRMTAGLAAALAVFYFGYEPFYTLIRHRSLNGIRDWGYQLQSVIPSQASMINPHDMMVIDYSKDGTGEGALSANEIRSLRIRPDGSRRLLLAYLSIGEAEDYRFYWKKEWTEGRKNSPNAPTWLLGENPDWPSNYSIRFWETGWQKIIVTDPDSYLTRIVALGFDGVYLDKVDAFDGWRTNGRPSAKDEMIDFVAALSKSARARAPSFLIVAQNADGLVDDKRFLDAIDGVARENLVFSDTEQSGLRPSAEIQASIERLRNVLAYSKVVLVIEYNETPVAEYAKRGLEVNGFKTTLAPRSLQRSSGYQRLLELSAEAK